MLNKLIATLSSIALCAAASGCVVVDPVEQPAPVAHGTLTTSWTLDGSAHQDVCSYYRIDSVHVFILDDAGSLILDEEPFCEDFGLSIDVTTGWYSTEVTLLDLNGRAVSDTIVTDVLVQRDTETFVDVDFPDGSIL